MQYPEHLIPRLNYKIMHSAPWLLERFLIRYTPDRDLLDPDTDKLKLDYIVINTDHLRDFSTNLFSVFTYEDCLWHVKDLNDPKDTLNAPWKEDEEGKYPSSEQAFQIIERGCFFANQRFSRNNTALYYRK